MSFELGCKFTVFYFSMGALGSLIAVLVLPGCYTEIPRITKVRGQWRIEWAVLGRLVAGGVLGCIADRNGVNAFFAGFFAWHFFKWLSEEGWKALQRRLETYLSNMLGPKGPRKNARKK